MLSLHSTHVIVVFLFVIVSVDSCSIIYFESKFENLDINKSRRNEKIGSQRNELITVARSILHPLPNYEAQEMTLLIDFPDGS